MKKEGKKREMLLWVGIYTLAFGVAATAIIWMFQVNGKSFIKQTDGVAQHFPVLCYIREYLLQIIRTGDLSFPMVDFSVGQGFDIIGTLNYYGFGDPITLLTVLFPENALETMYAFLIFLRLYLSGLGFMIFCRTLNQRTDAAAVSGALLYVFSSFAMVGGFKHPCFLNGMMYLPFLLTGIERIIKKKGTLVLALTVACSFMSNYYFMYMNTVLAGIYLLIRLTGHYREMGIKGFLQIVGKIILGYVWGLCLGGVIVLPAVYGFLNNAREISQMNAIPLFYQDIYYGTLWKSLADIPTTAGDWAAAGTGAVGIVSVILLLVKHPKKERRLILAVAVLAIMLCIPVFGSVMNGFSYVVNRWSYGFSLVMAFTAARMLPYLKEFTAKQRVAVVAGTLVYCIPFLQDWIKREKTSDLYLAILVLLTAVLVLAAGWAMEKGKTKVISYAVICITLGGILWSTSQRYMANEGNALPGFVPKGKVTEILDSSPAKAMELSQDDSFYRVEEPWNLFNHGLWRGINTVGYYYSVVPGTISDLYGGVGLNALERAYVLNGLDSRTALSAIAAVKYYTSNQEISIPYGYEKKGEVKDAQGNNCHLYENTNPLPLGYTYDKVMLREDYDTLEALEKQQTLLETAVVDKTVEGIESYEGSPSTVIADKEITVLKSDGVTLEQGKMIVTKNSSITLGFQGEPDSETYLVLKGLYANDKKKDGGITAKSKLTSTILELRGKKNHNYLEKDSQILNLGYSQDAQTECTLTFKQKRTYHFDEIKIQCVSMKDMDETIQDRKAECLENIAMDTNQVTGDISVTSSKVLQFSIPYSEGWKVYVDGEKADTFVSDVAYMGILLEAGSHKILLKYTSPWVIPGGMLTILGLLAIVMYLVMQRRNKGDRSLTKEEK